MAKKTAGGKEHSKERVIHRSSATGRFTEVRSKDAKTVVKNRHPGPRPPRDRTK